MRIRRNVFMDDSVYKKLKIIAKKNKRLINAEIEVILIEKIAEQNKLASEKQGMTATISSDNTQTLYTCLDRIKQLETVLELASAALKSCNYAESVWRGKTEKSYEFNHDKVYQALKAIELLGKTKI